MDPVEKAAYLEEYKKARQGVFESIFDEEYWRYRKLSCEHQVHLLNQRETGLQYSRYRKTRVEYRNDRDFYPTIRMESSAFIETPRLDDSTFVGSFLAWSPDGRYMLMAFDQFRKVRVFRYEGVENAIDKPAKDVLSSLFTKIGDVTLIESSEVASASLRAELICFTRDSKHVVMFSTGHGIDPSQVTSDYQRNNESLGLFHTLDSYHMFVIEIAKATITGHHVFSPDKIYMTSGVSLCDRTLVILSQHNQILFVFSINKETGALFLEREIGPSVLEDDPLHLATDFASAHLRTYFYSGLKQSVNKFLYERAKKKGNVAEFLQKTADRNSMRMVRVQLLCNNYIFVRMINVTRMTYTPSQIDYSQQPCFFLLIDWKTGKVIDVFDTYDYRFLQFFELAVDEMTHPSQTYFTDSPLTFRHNFYAHESYWRSRTKCLEQDRAWLTTDICRRLLNPLPLYSTQMSVASPYLDPSIFIIDESFFRNVLGGRVHVKLEVVGGTYCAGPVQYYSRRTGKPTFKFYLPAPVAQLLPSKQLCLLYHPTDPLCIGVDRTRADPKVLVYYPKAHEERGISGENVIKAVPDYPSSLSISQATQTRRHPPTSPTDVAF